MGIYRVHLYKEFSQMVEVEASSPQEALDMYPEIGDFPDWEESGDEYVSAVTDPEGNEHAVQDGELV